MKTTLVLAALLGAQAIPILEDRGIQQDRFDNLYDDEVSALIKR